MYNRKTKISPYVIDKKYGSNSSEECYNYKDIARISKTVEFPYRKDYIGDTSIKVNLEKIFEIDPIIRKEKWVIPDGKIISKISNFN